MVLRFVTSARTRWSLFRLRAEEERGATAVEYALMLALITAVIVGAVTLLGQGTDAGLRSVQFP
jgi:pilus assembly protein Flp/PilA